MMNLSKEERRFTGRIAILVIATVISLWPSLFNGWVNWDDEGYVLDNLLVHQFSWDSFRQMFTTTQIMGLYHPLTLISLAVDYHARYGKDPASY